jgi:hypothetical protein
MAQQASIPVKFIGPNGDELPLPGYTLVRQQYVDILIEILAGARSVATAYDVYDKAVYASDAKRKASDALIGTLESLKKTLVVTKKIEDHLAALGEGPTLPAPDAPIAP